MLILTARWEEPCEGIATWSCQLNEAEIAKVEGILDWLESHADLEYGNTLCEWDFTSVKGDGPGDLNSLDEVLNTIALNSRHNETDVPGDFYGEAHPDLTGR